MQYPYTPPEFLLGQSVDEIHERMLAAIPDGIDKSEPGIVWDFTRPSAMEKAEYVEFVLNRAIQLVFPHWAWGEWLDLHGEKVRIIRKEANRAYGVLAVTGLPGTTIPAGFQFATPASLSPSILFESMDEVTLDGTLDSNGQVAVYIPIQAVEGGTVGNVAPDTVKLMAMPITGITYISNENAITGGTAEEDDENLRERVLDAMRKGTSFVGNNADYVRWAEEVPGVGNAICIPEPFGPGTVELIVVDGNGIPANQQILDAVHLHIMGTGPTDISRIAPIGAILTVVAPEAMITEISATALLDDGESISTVITRFKNSLDTYWHVVAQETQDNVNNIGTIRFVQVGAALAHTPGVTDYSDLLVNGDISNISITQEQYPVTGSITINGVTEVFMVE